MKEELNQAIHILKNGGIVIFPTDTAFGIGCRMDDEAAIKRLFSIRKRPETQATPVLVSDVAMAEEYITEISSKVRTDLMDKYWPGALTIVLPCHVDKVPNLVRGGSSTIGVRVPNHDIARELIAGVGVPLLGPSANFHGEQTPYAIEDLNPELIKLVDYVVPGECSVKQASTVINCTKEPWQILRQGAVHISL
jgi:L-threonylcarbamoyladenylate synthase